MQGRFRSLSKGAVRGTLRPLSTSDIPDLQGNRMGKLRHFVIVACRSLRAHWLSAILSLAGLSFAFALSLFSGMIIWMAFSSDGQWENADRIYVLEQVRDGIYLDLPEGFLEDVRMISPVVESVTGLRFTNTEFKNRDQLDSHWALAVSPNFLSMFDIESIAGGMANVMEHEGMVAISEIRARRIYGSEDVVGQVFEATRRGIHKNFIVGAVYRTPKNTSLIGSDIIFRYSEAENFFRSSETEGLLYHRAFLKLTEGADAHDLANRLNKLFEEKYPNQEEAAPEPLELAPLKGAKISELSSGEMRFRYLGLFGSTLLLLVTALLNYILLSITVAATRCKDIALRKIMGARKSELAGQYILESLILVTVAYLVGLALAALAAPYLGAVAGQEFSIDTTERSFIHLTSWKLAGFVISGWGLALLAGLVSSAYPVGALVQYKPIDLLRSMQRGIAGGGVRLRSLLLLAQTLFGLGLTFAAGVAYFQIDSFETADKGFDTNGILYLRLWGANNALRNAGGPLVTAIRRIDGVENAALVHSANPLENRIFEQIMDHPQTGNPISVPTMRVGDQFIETLGLPVIAGRITAAPPVQGDNDPAPSEVGIVVNERFVAAYGLGSAKQALGICLTYYIERNVRSQTCRSITAVVGDHYQKLDENPVTPVVFVPQSGNAFYNIMVRYDPTREQAVFNAITNVWDHHLPLYPIFYRYLDDILEDDVRSRLAIARLLILAAVGALVLTMAGLYALTKFIVLKRRREIAIRRAHGATGLEVVKLLLTQLMRPVLAGAVFGLSVSWYFSMEWLQTFAVRIAPQPWHVVTLGIIVIAFFILTVTGEVFRAARLRPAEVLHHE